LKQKEIYQLVCLLTLSLLFISCQSDQVSGPSASPDTSPMWPQAGYNGRHTGNPSCLKVKIPPVLSGTVYWIDTIDANSSFRDGSESCIDGLGNIYHLSTRNYPYMQLIKFRPDGSIIWTADTLYLDPGFGIALSGDETHFYYSDWMKLTCRDSSGKFIWSLPGSSLFVIPAIGKDGTIYTIINLKLSAVSPGGTIIWQAGNNIYSSWIALDRTEYIYVNYNTGSQFIVSKFSKYGGQLWSYPYLTSVQLLCRSVVIDGYNNIYFNSNDSIISLDKDGKFRWSRYPGQQEYVPCITKDNRIIIDSANCIIAVDTGGKNIWKTEVNSSSFIHVEPCFALDDNDNVYFNYWDSQMFLDVCSIDRSGNIRWTCIEPVAGLVLPGLTLSPLAQIFDTPKRPQVVFSLK